MNSRRPLLLAADAAGDRRRSLHGYDTANIGSALTFVPKRVQAGRFGRWAGWPAPENVPWPGARRQTPAVMTAPRRPVQQSGGRWAPRNHFCRTLRIALADSSDFGMNPATGASSIRSAKSASA